MKKLLLLFLLLPAFVSADTLTVYPDPHTESTSVDGRIGLESDNTVWGTIQAAASGSFTEDSTEETDMIFIMSGSASNWRYIVRSFLLFDTSALTSGVTVSAATLSVYGIAKADGASITPDANIYSSNPASNTALANGDFDQVGTTAFSTAITYAGWNTAGYNDFAFNANGLAAIDQVGVSKFSFRNASYDAANSAPTRNGNNLTAGIGGALADKTGTSQDPMLVITYSAASTASPVTDQVVVFE